MNRTSRLFSILKNLVLTTCCGLFVAIVFPDFSHADIRLPKIFGDHMVLQQEKPIRFFGWADPGEAIEISMDGEVQKTAAGKNGRWRVELLARSADGEAFDVTIKGKNTIKLKNVVLGEVWLCSGQSNMEWPVRASMNADKEIAAAKHEAIRLFNVPGHFRAQAPNEDTPGQWQVCSPKSIANFSAVAYYFGRKIHQETKVPIGLIGTNWGGTRIEPWIPPVGFSKVPELKAQALRLRQVDPTTNEGQAFYNDYLDRLAKWTAASREALKANQRPSKPPTLDIDRHIGGATTIYNGMVHGLAPFQVRGTIWYQGESNAGQGEKYYPLKKALIAGWREVFENKDMSFYWVQLANFQAASDNPAGGGWGPVREGQRLALSVPKTGMAVTIDIGDARDIHPRNKQDVGGRLALWALRDHYGKMNVPSGPLYKSMKVEDGKIRISFDHVGGGLITGSKKGLEPTKETSDSKLKRFAIAGADKIWVWADAKIDGETVLVWSDQVPKPVAVRYGYESNPVGANLYNTQGLPASPFRTDDW